MLTRPFRTALVASCAALALTACREDDRVASAALGYGVAPSALAYDPALAPEVEALPATGPAPVGRLVSYDDGYAWAERAYAIDRAFYGAPPDYGFYYDDVEPWVWESEDHWTLYAEPISGGYRYYYYEPGDAYPYFVRDDEYGYGYDDAGRLVTLYTVAGVLLPVSYLDQRADLAGRYWHRAHDLRRAAKGDRRARIAREQWLARQPVFQRSRDPWMEAAVRRDDWRTYRVRHEQRDVRRFERERQRREAAVERLNRDDLRRAGRDWRERREGEQVAALAPEAQGRWAWGGRRDDDGRRGYGERRLDDRRDGDRERRWSERQEQRQQFDAERRGPELRDRVARQQQARLEGERRGREEMRARQEQRRQQMARIDNERRGRDQMQAQQRQQAARVETERRGRQEAERRGREEQAQRMQQRQQMARAETERRGRQEAERRGREQQARAEGERRNREQMQAQRAQQRQQAESDRRGREQQARAEGERRGREHAQRQAQQRQAQQQQAQQARQEARNAQQAARDAGGRERADRGQGRGGRRED